MNGDNDARRAWVADFIELMYVRHDIEAAFDRYVAEDYVQHNPGLADGRDAAVSKLAPTFSHPDFRTDVKRWLLDGDLVCIHLHGRREPETGGAIADFYRIEERPGGERLVEHWDVIQPIPQTSANPHPMF